MAKKLTYSKALPTEPGWYWVKGKSWGEESQSVQFVRWFGDQLAIGNNPIKDSDNQWAGPIPPPEKPKSVPLGDVRVGYYWKSIGTGKYYYKCGENVHRELGTAIVANFPPSKKVLIVC